MISLLCGIYALCALLRHYRAALHPLKLVFVVFGIWALSFCALDLRSACMRYVQLLILAAIARIDCCHLIIPNLLSVSLLMAGLLAGVQPPLPQMLLAALPAFIMLAMNRLWKPCFGAGDIKLCLICAILRGTAFLRWLRLSLLLGGLYAAMALISKRCKAGSRLPLAPWLVLADAMSLLAVSGQNLL